MLTYHILANHQSFACECICVLSSLLRTVSPQCPSPLQTCICSTLLSKDSAFKTPCVPIKAANMCACFCCLLDSKCTYHPGGMSQYAYLCWLHPPQQWFSAFLVCVYAVSSPPICTARYGLPNCACVSAMSF